MPRVGLRLTMAMLFMAVAQLSAGAAEEDKTPTVEDVIMKQMDADGDDKLSMEEIIKPLRVRMDLSDPEEARVFEEKVEKLKKSFDEADANKDGFLVREEFWKLAHN